MGYLIVLGILCDLYLYICSFLEGMTLFAFVTYLHKSKMATKKSYFGLVLIYLLHKYIFGAFKWYHQIAK